MDQVINLLQTLMQQAGELADQLSEEEMAQVLSIFEQALAFIQEQELEGQIGAKPEDLPPSDIASSNVNGFFYNPDTQELKVQFHGPYPNAAGSIYSYQNVPQYIYDIFSRGAIGPRTSGKNRYHEWIKNVTPSLGGALNALLKSGGFEYSKLS